ncbi:hypothetical protein TNIN_367331 [Trichonephila inaurata madagascariensis]|uniref:Uncharacterized protein n=1 Tax=Trichonephila inaurata madagascariensis TaxID=2747483 RepID=A0A8X6XAJ5_9ARAC|nr:hypothetical protein TNIN_367331 [Trichonephila inaurata madagascariensis]
MEQYHPRNSFLSTSGNENVRKWPKRNNQSSVVLTLSFVLTAFVFLRSINLESTQVPDEKKNIFKLMEIAPSEQCCQFHSRCSAY